MISDNTGLSPQSKQITPSLTTFSRTSLKPFFGNQQTIQFHVLLWDMFSCFKKHLTTTTKNALHSHRGCSREGTTRFRWCLRMTTMTCSWRLKVAGEPTRVTGAAWTSSSLPTKVRRRRNRQEVFRHSSRIPRVEPVFVILVLLFSGCHYSEAIVIIH